MKKPDKGKEKFKLTLGLDSLRLSPGFARLLRMTGIPCVQQVDLAGRGNFQFIAE